jgi:DNA (cytosine-5)-methyltransferase 1
MSKLKILDLCSGIGGFSLGLEATGGFETIAFCEFDPFCQKVLNKHWPEVPIYNDLKEISKDEETIRNIPEHDLICGGIPCQPFSLAGKQKGKEDDRHLWPFMFKIIEQKKPTWVIVENVGGFINVALDDVCLDLEAEGYATQSFIIPACGVEAPHRRDRIWIIGKRDVVDSDSTRTGHRHGEVQKENGEVQQRNDHAESNHASEKQDVVDSKCNEHNREIGGRFEEEGGNEEQERKENSTARKSSGTSEVWLSDNRYEGSEDVADSNSERLQGAKQHGTSTKEYKTSNSITESFKVDGSQWTVEPRVGRVANGVPNRVDRLKSLGNAIVPQIIYHIGLAILKEEE